MMAGVDNQLRTRLLACTGEGALVQDHALRVRRHAHHGKHPGAAIRAALEALAAAAPGWLAGVIDASWQRAYGQRIDDLRLPDSQAARAPPTPITGRPAADSPVIGMTVTGGICWLLGCGRAGVGSCLPGASWAWRGSAGPRS